MKRLAIFASGSGTNAERIIETFKEDRDINVEVVFSNKPDAFVLERARKHGVRAEVFTRVEFRQGSFLDRISNYRVDYLILAGFLWKIPDYLIEAYPDKIINIHPSLLPKHGGKGMYGMHVHQAVIAAGDEKSGISIHLVNEKYDDGKILFQAHCEVSTSDSPDTLAQKIHALEHIHFPRVIREFVRS